MTVRECESVFHAGEQIVQERMGVREAAETLGGRFVLDYLTVEHQEFYRKLPFVFVGSVDESGRPWASILYGRPGFLSTPADSTLRVQARPFLADPLSKSLATGAPLGFLGIEYETRRRNRLAGRVAAVTGDYFEVQVDQSFGNCPQFIQSRSFVFLPQESMSDSKAPVCNFDRLDERAKSIIRKADNFYIATYSGLDSQKKCNGVDISHRGGKPGFIKVVDETHIKFPDFRGNNLFNTLGNIELNPLAGLLFIDFDRGDLLYLTGEVKVDWDNSNIVKIKGAQSIVNISITSGLLIPRALPMRWKFDSYSPVLEQTGIWESSDDPVKEKPSVHDYRKYQVFRTENESEVIRSFYLKPADGAVLPDHQAGQYLPVGLSLPDRSAPVKRTYTISNAPNGQYFRLSIKREVPLAEGKPPGVVSNYFHDHIVEGSVIHAAMPQGNFVLEANSDRPVVLLSGGIGITPMLSMLQQLLYDLDEGKSKRKIWFIHAARNSAVHGFRNFLQSKARRYSNLNLYTVYSDPLPSDQYGVHFDTVGYVDIELLKKILPLDDYEYYYCGPPPFMASLKKGLELLNVSRHRIHYEFFGSPPVLSRNAVQSDTDSSLQSVQVCFGKSGFEAAWNPSRGTLLEFAESEGLNPIHSCRSGICHTCATALISGTADYVNEPEVAPAPGSVLICCAIPHQGAVDSGSGKLILDL